MHYLRLTSLIPLGTLTLTHIDHVRIFKSNAYPTPIKGGITGQSDPKHASIHKEINPASSLNWQYSFKD